MRWLFVAALAACACPGKQGPSAGTTGGSTAASDCDSIRPKLEQLYRADAQAQEPKATPERIAEAISDNTTMVMNECTTTPGKVVPCVQSAKTVAELESTCLAPLDDEGTEGEALRK